MKQKIDNYDKKEMANYPQRIEGTKEEPYPKVFSFQIFHQIIGNLTKNKQFTYFAEEILKLVKKF